MKATVITDASYCPHTKGAGWALWVTPDRGVRVKKYGRFKRDPKHSAEAELWALINGIAAATRIGAKLIIAQSDCQTALDAIQMNPELVWSALREVELSERPTLKLRHVRGHTRINAPRYFVNRWCDKYAGLVMRTIRAEREA